MALFAGTAALGSGGCRYPGRYRWWRQMSSGCSGFALRFAFVHELNDEINQHYESKRREKIYLEASEVFQDELAVKRDE